MWFDNVTDDDVPTDFGDFMIGYVPCVMPRGFYINTSGRDFLHRHFPSRPNSHLTLHSALTFSSHATSYHSFNSNIAIHGRPA